MEYQSVIQSILSNLNMAALAHVTSSQSSANNLLLPPDSPMSSSSGNNRKLLPAPFTSACPAAMFDVQNLPMASVAEVGGMHHHHPLDGRYSQQFGDSGSVIINSRPATASSILAGFSAGGFNNGSAKVSTNNRNNNPTPPALANEARSGLPLYSTALQPPPAIENFAYANTSASASSSDPSPPSTSSSSTSSASTPNNLLAYLTLTLQQLVADPDSTTPISLNGSDGSLASNICESGFLDHISSIYFRRNVTFNFLRFHQSLSDLSGE